MKFINSIKGLLSPGSRGFWIMLAVVVPVIPAIGLTFSGVFSQDFQDWLIGIESDRESGSTTIRNLGLIFAGLVALPLAIWRGYVAYRQADAAHRQADIAQQQIDAAQRGLRNERYQKGADMLGSDVPSVRMGGIYALHRLAEEYPEEYHVQIMRLFCAFVRSPTKDKVYENQINNEDLAPSAREDVEAVIHAIGNRSEEWIELEREAKFLLDLRNANLHSMTLSEANLSNATFVGSDLSSTILFDTNLSHAFLMDANLSDADLTYANLSDADLRDCNISSAYFDSVKGLTQKQLDQARAGIFNRPKLKGALDAESGKELKWEGGQGLPL